MFLVVLVCLSVCLSASEQHYQQISIKFYGEVQDGTRKN